MYIEIIDGQLETEPTGGNLWHFHTCDDEGRGR